MKIIQRYFLSKSLKERVLIIAIVSSLIVIMFPPFDARSITHSFLFKPPSYTYLASWEGVGFTVPNEKYYNISFEYLGIELAVIWLIAGLIYVLKKD